MSIVDIDPDFLPHSITGFSANQICGCRWDKVVAWDGIEWREIPVDVDVESRGFKDIRGSAPCDIFVAGGSEWEGALMEHWNGSGWHSDIVPIDADIKDIWPVSNDSVFAVGSSGSIR